MSPSRITTITAAGWLSDRMVTSILVLETADRRAIHWGLAKTCRPCWVKCCVLTWTTAINIPFPTDNPFVKGGGLPEIWAYGLRNPWRFSFDHMTGDMFIADVGQDAWEEVNVIPAGTPGGMNFGWSYYEGMHSYKGQPPANGSFTQPVYEYSHAEGCAVTGGYVYRGRTMPEWQGVYFFGDYCSGNIWGLIRPGGKDQQAKILFKTGAKITTFGVDEAGEIYLADYGSGRLFMLTRKQ